MGFLNRWLARQVPFCEARLKDAQHRLSELRWTQRHRGGKATQILEQEKRVERCERRLSKALTARENA